MGEPKSIPKSTTTTNQSIIPACSLLELPLTPWTSENLREVSSTDLDTQVKIWVRFISPAGAFVSVWIYITKIDHVHDVWIHNLSIGMDKINCMFDVFNCTFRLSIKFYLDQFSFLIFALCHTFSVIYCRKVNFWRIHFCLFYRWHSSIKLNPQTMLYVKYCYCIF